MTKPPSREDVRDPLSLPPFRRVVRPAKTCRWPCSDGRFGCRWGSRRPDATASQRDLDRRCIRAGFGSLVAVSERVVGLRALEGIGKARRQRHAVGGEGSLAGPRLVGAGRDERWPSRTSRDPDKGPTREELGRCRALSRSRGISQCYGRRPERERIRVAGRRGDPEGCGRRGALVPSGSRSFRPCGHPALCGHHIAASAP